MKVMWDAGDIEVGRRVRNPTSHEAWILGYLHPHAPGAEAAKVFCKISLADGMVQQFESKEKLAAHLNLCGEQPVELVGETPKL